MGGGGEDEGSLEFTPTWVVAGVCTVIVAISLTLERLLHYTGKEVTGSTLGNSLWQKCKHLKKKKQKHLYEALQKVKEELMLLGFISLLLTVFQSRIVKICVPHRVVTHLLPCSLSLEGSSHSGSSLGGSPSPPEVPRPSNNSVHYHPGPHHQRHLLAAEETPKGYCSHKHKVPLLSLEALHHLHIFIFVLAIVHVTFSVLTIVFGGVKIRQWKSWEDAIVKVDPESEHDQLKPSVTHVHEHDFIRNRFQGIGKQSLVMGWAHSFCKQFYASVNESDYRALRLGFIMLLLAVGTKLEHVIIQLAHEIAEKHVAVEGELIVTPSDDHFWFIIQVLCSYSTLPLYALVTQMGSHYKKSMFDKHVQACLLDWADKAKKKKGLKIASPVHSIDGSVQGSPTSVSGPKDYPQNRV
ncbi:hypothetical protein CQW23_15747 [Capsicum baccatum]|uniref:MLO-like protein n=1 Tax=Capsicum baccatum TaxID=33114 RepID=A0A2G2WN32_CAPBA|nr:hypothetical protein CQW23_15747 [Capsicum baccatum]